MVGDDRWTHDGLDGVDGQPPLAGLFVSVLVVSWCVLQDERVYEL